MSALIIGVDLAATQFELALANDRFELRQRRRLDRAQFAQFCRELSPCLILMEACGSAHFWERALRGSGHQVRLLPAQYVRPYVRCNKTDAADAAALLEAVRCSELRPVPVKYSRPTKCAAATSPARAVQADTKCPVKFPARGCSGVGCLDSQGRSKEPCSASRRNRFSARRMAGSHGQDVCAGVGGDRRTTKGNDRGGKGIALSDAPRPCRAWSADHLWRRSADGHSAAGGRR
jgi:hypothetical protein